MRRFVLSISLALGVACLSGCGCSAEPAGGGPCSTSADCEAGFRCIDGTCEREIDAGDGADGSTTGRDGSAGDDGAPADGSCGGEAVDFDYRPPNVLVVFDRSCSMRRRLDDTSQFGSGPDDTRTRWNVAREAVLDQVMRFETRIFWGLMAFPDPREGCGMPVDAEVAPGPGTRAAIDGALRRNQIQPFGLCGPDNSDTTTQPRETPTADALTSAMALPELSDAMRSSFIVLVTDGGVSCGVSNAALMALASSLDAAGIPLAVIGFATGSSDVTTLEALASSGGLPNPAAPPSYYVAESRADLDAAFDEISARVVSCDLALGTAPPADADVFVNVNGAPLAEDATDGWSYDPATNTLTFNGAACARLRSGEVTRIDVSYGCAPVACTPRPEVCNGLDEDCDGVVDEDCLL